MPLSSVATNLKPSVSDEKRERGYVSIILLTPQWLQEVYTHVNDGSVEVNVESCDWLNVIVDFLFRELRDSPTVKRLVHYHG